MNASKTAVGDKSSNKLSPRSEKIVADHGSCLMDLGYSLKEIEEVVRQCGKDDALLQERLARLIEEGIDNPWCSADKKPHKKLASEKSSPKKRGNPKGIDTNKSSGSYSANRSSEKTKKNGTRNSSHGSGRLKKTTGTEPSAQADKLTESAPISQSAQSQPPQRNRHSQPKHHKLVNEFRRTPHSKPVDQSTQAYQISQSAPSRQNPLPTQSTNTSTHPEEVANQHTQSCQRSQPIQSNHPLQSTESDQLTPSTKINRAVPPKVRPSNIDDSTPPSTTKQPHRSCWAKIVGGSIGTGDVSISPVTNEQPPVLVAGSKAEEAQTNTEKTNEIGRDEETSANSANNTQAVDGALETTASAMLPSAAVTMPITSGAVRVTRRTSPAMRELTATPAAAPSPSWGGFVVPPERQYVIKRRPQPDVSQQVAKPLAHTGAVLHLNKPPSGPNQNQPLVETPSQMESQPHPAAMASSQHRFHAGPMSEDMYYRAFGLPPLCKYGYEAPSYDRRYDVHEIPHSHGYEVFPPHGYMPPEMPPFFRSQPPFESELNSVYREARSEGAGCAMPHPKRTDSMEHVCYSAVPAPGFPPHTSGFSQHPAPYGMPPLFMTAAPSVIDTAHAPSHLYKY
eukprot:Gregarina_sp_Poly_1__3156@NODE_1895_length_3127_cov_7_819608_g1227_i0_p1_GENE_NODE_1895_length_3127_cov_7_819608_g1227_i0NODE_1895_length_3127_cov_7_819608_g1227_i0_p1_ORF_typecomplete_len622_score63_04RuvA_C/PF07499_13/0_36_NODE_1895_length_3127_cov_7_819608_g1227_i0761941